MPRWFDGRKGSVEIRGSRLSPTGKSRRFAVSKKTLQAGRVALELLETLQYLSACGVVSKADMTQARALQRTA